MCVEVCGSAPYLPTIRFCRPLVPPVSLIWRRKNTKNQFIMKKVSFKTLVENGIVRTFNTLVKQSSGGLLYFTIFDSNGRTQNVYFGQRSSEQLADGELLTKEQFLKMEFIVATNAGGETRVKASLQGEPREDNTYKNAAAFLGVSAPIVEDMVSVVAELEKNWVAVADLKASAVADR